MVKAERLKNLLPSLIIRQEIYNLILGAIRVGIPLEPRELIYKPLISLHGINVCKALDHKFQSESNDLEKTEISISLYLA